MKIRIFILFVLLILLAILVSLFKVGKTEKIEEIKYHQSAWNEYSRDIDWILTGIKSYAPSHLKHIYGVVVSHHIPTTLPRIIQSYERLKSTQSVDNFIIIGPDHTNAGKMPISVSNSTFYTAYGKVSPIEGLAKELFDRGLVNIDESPFYLEHSVGSQILVISKIFPNAKVTPVILRSDTSAPESDKLAEFLAGKIDEKTVIITSVDFSHYLPTSQAVPMDQVSGEIIRKLDLDSLSLVKVDSEKSVRIFMKVMTAKGANGTDDFSVLNTNDFMQNSDNTTGYVFGYWGIND